MAPSPRPPDLRRNLLYVIIAEATNMGLSAMSESCGVPYDTLAWTAEWYLSEEALEAANAAIVNYHHRLPMTQSFGTGTLSSSDGQKFPVKGKSLTAVHLSRHFARGHGVSTYTHVSDQHSTFDTKVITSTSPESPYALDGILGNETDLLITEHATELADREKLGEEYDRFTAARPRTLTASERDRIRALAADVPGIWHAPTTTDADRKRLIRHLIEQVRVSVAGVGRGTSTTCRTSTGPYSSNRTAFTGVPPFFRKQSTAGHSLICPLALTYPAHRVPLWLKAGIVRGWWRWRPTPRRCGPRRPWRPAVRGH
ncbi:MAG: Tn3 family transposase [Streptosporangiaceae bacterium]